nr:MAG TPA: hypothetical protein [Caudoviricetes sp.]
MSETQRDFSKPVKLIFSLLPAEHQESMRFPLESMTGYVKETGDTESTGAEGKFRVFMLMYRHLLISKRLVDSNHFGKNFMDVTTDELWKEAQQLYISLKNGGG